ncbi:MAG: phytanoyl-CoA dioxygenase family protein [Cyclobacteriaceae bacterium]|nr:phytanoyl-CoA dioxygenase family protein [Cyclobacteriaceae bacterium]
MKNYLEKLGVNGNLLSQEEKKFLDDNGYLILENVLSGEEINKVVARINELLELERDAAGAELFDSPNIKHPKEVGVDRLADLVNKGSVFDQFYTTPKVLAGVGHVLGNYMKLSSLNYRAALPGDGLQKLHTDWKERIAPEDYKVCNTIWLLDDFTKANGCTRLVPGSNHSEQLPEELMDDPMAPHPLELLMEAPAGTVVICNSHTWHGGTTNHTDKPRRAMHSYFCRRDQPQQLDQSKYIREETRDRIGDAGEYLLGV